MPATVDNSAEAWSTTAQHGSQNGSASSGVEGSRMASPNESASRARAWAVGNENVGLRAVNSNWTASQRATHQQRRMRALLEGMVAPLGAVAPPAPNQDATYRGEGMLNELEELYQNANTQKK